MIDKSQYWGITENCDPAFKLEIFDNLYKGNTIITKRLTNKLIEKLIEHKDKIILHLTCTGSGGTIIEPFVPSPEQNYEKCKQLIEGGFPVSHVVLRVDPVIPTDKGIETASKVIRRFADLNIKRVRWSSMDMYNHVKDRFKTAGLPLSYETFHAPSDMIIRAHNSLKSLCSEYGMELECCGEGLFNGTPCLSQKDVDILRLTNEIILEGDADQRKTCSCPSNKKQLFHGEKPKPCEHKCLYCYWKDV